MNDVTIPINSFKMTIFFLFWYPQNSVACVINQQGIKLFDKMGFS